MTTSYWKEIVISHSYKTNEVQPFARVLTFTLLKPGGTLFRKLSTLSNVFYYQNNFEVAKRLTKPITISTTWKKVSSPFNSM